MSRRQREATHYKPRKYKEKEYYSLRSLVPEIAGISNNAGNFDAVYKEIQRVVQTFQSLEGIEKGTLRIHRDLKDGFVKATRGFYEKDEFKHILAKIRNNENLTIKEHDKLITHFLEATLIGMEEDEAVKLKEAVEQMIGDEFYEKRDQIEKIIIQDMERVDEVKHHPTKLNYMDEYIEILTKALQDWRQSVEYHIVYDKAYERVVQREPHLLQKEPLTNENISPELLTEIMFEVTNILHENGEGTDK